MSRAERQPARFLAGPDLAAALVHSQALASAGAALYRNQQLRNDLPPRQDARMHDFDFLFGRWRVHNQRLRQRLVGCTDWQQFEAIMDCRPILGGFGNIDEFVTDEFGSGVFIGASLRLYEAAANRWSIYWASNRTGVLEPPVTGGFQDGVGHFEGDDQHDGVPVRVRFTWQVAGSERATWEQAFSLDTGRTWETNWRMQLTRLAAPEGPIHGAAAC